MPDIGPVSRSAAAVTRITRVLDAFCAAEKLPAEAAWRLRVAVDEVVANIVSHGARGGAVPDIEITCRREDTRVLVTIADDGPAFDPLDRPDPDVTLPLDARQPGGLGLALVKSLMHAVRYERTTRNVLTLIEEIEPSSGGA